ncbi:aminotransferase class V-fold PLP-dependent enzyme [Candidatus Parcubacteria bacterium]|nr:aminotransferase class V-fold PLP-dependent enzyme [Candidatus Parcubacteria bacterium]
MDKRISSITLGESNTIKEAMERINKTGLRIVIITNESKKLLGVVTDGDIRRALLTGKNFQTLLKEIITTSPIKAVEGAPAMDLLKIMAEKNIQEIPIVDKNGVLVDIVLLSEIKSIPLSSPDITSKDVEAINQVLSTSFLSIGPKVKEFEKKIANYIGVKYAVAVNSGTSGLHLCVRSLDIKDGDEVITAPFSFIASANCMLFERAKPVFVDIDEKTLCIDVNKIEEKITEKTKAIMPVHIFGHSCEMDKIMEIAKKHNLAVIEDACEAIGGEYKGKKVGSFGDASVFAFYPNKQITTAEGGMIVTDNEKIAKLCQSMRNQGRDDNNEWLSHMRLGYNYRMSELSAALGVAQMDRIDEILGKRQKIAEYYNEQLKKINGVEIPYASLDVKMSWFVYTIKLDSKRFSRENRNQAIEDLRKRGIACKAYFPPIHLEPFYVDMFDYKKGSFPVTESVSDLTIALPFYNNLPEKEIDYICDSLKDIMESLND